MEKHFFGITYFISFLIFYGCNFTVHNKSFDESNNETYFIKNKNTIVNHVLYEEIIDFIYEQDSILKDYNKWPIYMIKFSSTNQKNIIHLVSTLIYDKKDFYGYLMIEEKMIAFYVKNNHNNVNFHNDFVDIDNLLKEPPSKFIHWKQEDIHPPIPPFNAKYRKYEVLENELVFVESGIW